MFSISEITDSSIQNDFPYDDSIPFNTVGVPPLINKGGLTSYPAKSTLSAIPPTTRFSCIIDWLSCSFKIEESFEPSLTQKVINNQEYDKYLPDEHLWPAETASIHYKAGQFLTGLAGYVPLLIHHDTGYGRNAYKHLLDLYRDGEKVGYFMYGGTTNRGTASLTLTGKGCSGVDMEPLRFYLENFPGAKLTRVDVAHDDLEGKRSVDWHQAQYRNGGYFIKGVTPKCQNKGDWTTGKDTEGRTFQVGNKANGKEACNYEKGKQLGDPTSPWVRSEVRFTDADHLIPFYILTAPEMFFAASYPVFADTWCFHERCEVIKKHAEIALDSLIAHLKVSYGKLINVMVEIGRSPEQIIESIIVSGTPKRLILPLLPMPEYSGVTA